MKKLSLLSFFFTLLLFCSSASAFEADELLVDDVEFGIEGASQPQTKSSEPATTRSTTRRRSADQDLDSKIQFSVEHAFGESDFVPAGTFTARLKTSSHGGQRCLPRESLDEHFVIHMKVLISWPSITEHLGWQLKLPTKWSFNSHTILKNGEQAPRAPIFAEQILGENGEGEVLKPPEKSFWAKYWMYLIPLGLVVMNAVTQAMNMPE